MIITEQDQLREVERYLDETYRDVREQSYFHSASPDAAEEKQSLRTGGHQAEEEGKHSIVEIPSPAQVPGSSCTEALSLRLGPQSIGRF